MIRGPKQLGIRRFLTTEEQTAPTTSARHWKVLGIPRSWQPPQVEETLQQAGFKDIDIKTRQAWKQSTAWLFRATIDVRQDYIQTQTEDGHIFNIWRQDRR